jgi:hypothetical protein
VGDIDDALLRPGRCFANVRFRALERAEVERLLVRLCGSDPVPLGRAIAAALPDETRSASLASIYRAEGAVRAAATAAGRATKLAGVAAN